MKAVGWGHHRIGLTLWPVDPLLLSLRTMDNLGIDQAVLVGSLSRSLDLSHGGLGGTRATTGIEKESGTVIGTVIGIGNVSVGQARRRERAVAAGERSSEIERETTNVSAAVEVMQAQATLGKNGTSPAKHHAEGLDHATKIVVDGIGRMHQTPRVRNMKGAFGHHPRLVDTHLRPLPRRPSQAARKKIGAGAAAGNRVIEIETGIEIVNATETTTATAAAEEEAPIVSVEDPGAMTVDMAMAVAGEA